MALAPVIALAACAAFGPGEDGPTGDLSAAVRRLSARLHGERVKAREALVRAGARAIPALREALRGPDRTARLEAARALGGIGGEAAQAALEELLLAEAAAARARDWADPSLAYFAAVAMCRTGAAGMARVAAIADGRVPELASIRHQADRAATDVLEPEIIAAFQRAHGGGSYPGRFAAMQRYGPAGVRKLAEIAGTADRTNPDERESHAQLAIQALGDIDLPEVVPALAALAIRLRQGTAGDRMVDEVAHSLFRRGAREMLERTIQELERLRPMAGLGRQGVDLDRLALCYLHADRFEDSVRTYRGLAQLYPQQANIHLYNAACAWSRAGKPVKALDALRLAIAGGGDRTHYADVDWMQTDGDLRAARELPGWDYLVACCIVRDRIHGEWWKADPGDVREALTALRRAHERGYGIEEQDDRDGLMLGGLCNHPEFERLWRAMGGDAGDGD